MTKNEKIYDEKIEPLMSQIISVCQKNNIPMVASFFIGDENDADFLCSSVLVGGKYKNTPPIYYAFAKGIGQ